MPNAPRIARQWVVVALVAGGVLPWAAAASSGSVPVPRPTLPAPTIEPTLPLTIDLRLADVARDKGRARATLEVDLVADADLRDVTWELDLPADVRLLDDPAGPHATGHLEKGQKRLSRLGLEAPADSDRVIHLRATFRDASGRLFKLGQGVTLAGPRVRPEGELHAGAYEVMAASPDELPR
jgi:hypothetical protein